jgi:hypothetical protein
MGITATLLKRSQCGTQKCLSHKGFHAHQRHSGPQEFIAVAKNINAPEAQALSVVKNGKGHK